MTPNACRLFTVAEANGLLPRLRPLLLALSKTAATLRDLDLQAREVAADLAVDLAARPAHAAVKRERREFQAALAREVARYREQLDRVRRLGVEVRDALVGRVDGAVRPAPRGRPPTLGGRVFRPTVLWLLRRGAASCSSGDSTHLPSFFIAPAPKGINTRGYIASEPRRNVEKDSNPCNPEPPTPRPPSPSSARAAAAS